jgi:Zn-dependent protease with chaperone function
MSFEGIFNQVFQPYFYYSVTSLVISFVCIKGLARFFNFMSRQTKSLLYLVPLLLPLVVMLVFIPSTVIQITSKQLMAMTVSMGGAIGAFCFSPFGLPAPPQTGVILVSVPVTTTVLSVSGIICLIGLIAGAFFAVSMILADDRLARRVLHVISLGPDEHQWLQAKIADSAKKLGISAPKIGVVEDLRPNAFTIGYGRRATIVFSIGLFSILDKEEVTAVAFHELAHVKNRDFFIKILSSALNVVSFFNPLSYVTSSTMQREREMLADERAIELLENPAVFGNALAKICKAIQTVPKQGMLVNFSSNLLVTSSVLCRLAIFSTHPRLDKRLRNISAPKPTTFHLNRQKALSTFFLSVLLMSVAIVASGAMINLQANYTSSQDAKAQSTGFKVTGYDVGGNNVALPSGFVPLSLDSPRNSNVQIISYPIIGNGVTVQLVNNSSFAAEEIPAGPFLLVHPQNSNYVVAQSPGTVSGEMWMG